MTNKHNVLSRLFAPFLVLVLVLGAGCSSSTPTTHRYLLTEPTSKMPLTPCADEHGTLAISVAVPDYLQRSGVVLALNDNEIRSARNHRWSEPLATGIRRAMEVQLPRINGELVIDVRHFHGHKNGQVVLDARWQLTHNQHTFGKAFVTTRQQSNAGYGALVNVHRELLKDLASQISAELVTTCVDT